MPKILFGHGQDPTKGGRKKGSKGKARFDVAEILKQNKCNPFEILAKIANGISPPNYNKPIGIYTQMEAARELASYVAPKLKAIEHSTTPDAPVKFQIEIGNP